MDGPKLGSLIADGDRRRDAVHIAVVPVTAGHQLTYGDRVGFAEGGTEVVWSTEFDGCDFPTVGIVDPFLLTSVEKGQRFWLFLYPNTVTSLRHVWTHPAFTAAPPPTPKPDPYPE